MRTQSRMTHVPLYLGSRVLMYAQVQTLNLEAFPACIREFQLSVGPTPWAPNNPFPFQATSTL